jgi:hypothetical protein
MKCLRGETGAAKPSVHNVGVALAATTHVLSSLSMKHYTLTTIATLGGGGGGGGGGRRRAGRLIVRDQTPYQMPPKMLMMKTQNSVSLMMPAVAGRRIICREDAAWGVGMEEGGKVEMGMEKNTSATH